MKSKKIIIISVAILYGLLSFLLFSEAFVIQLIEAQKTYYISESQNFEQFEFSKQGWEKLEDKNEFKHDGDYYDVKKASICKSKVTVTVIKDDYENLLKYISKNISPKNKKNKSSKMKRIFEVYIQKVAFTSIKSSVINIEHSYFYAQHLLNSYTFSVFRPPVSLKTDCNKITNT